MKSLYFLAIPLLAAQGYAATVSCTAATKEDFRQPEFTGGSHTLMSVAGSRAPNSYTTSNETWISQGYYTFALTVPRGTKSVSSDMCGCFNEMQNLMQKGKELCVCKFGTNDQSVLGVGRTESSKRQQKREYPEFHELQARKKKKGKKNGTKGVGAIKLPKCQ